MKSYVNLAVLAVLVASLYGPVVRELTVLGVFRSATGAVSHQGAPMHTIADTIHCEDLHYYRPAGQLFTACEDSVLPRFQWFPPVVTFKGPADTTGSIHVIDPKTMKSSRLTFENFSGPFLTHGIDITEDPERTDAVYIFAVNHLANPEYRGGDEPKARSQVELFHHVLNSGTIRHLRSIRHPLVTTPNDIYAVSPHSFYVTNDHLYREGYKRLVENLLPVAKWSTVIHVQLDSLAPSPAESGVDAMVAVEGLWNSNGLGHGPSQEEVLLTSAMGGYLWRMRPNDNRTLSLVDEFAFDSTIDNPSYYQDPYRTADDDASGYVLGGLLRAVELDKTRTQPEATDGVMVWYLRRHPGTMEWEKRLIFEDDGSRIRSASTALLVPKDSVAGEKKAWLFVTGFFSEAMIAVEVTL
ncbi:serum paraoxonase/arylesterase family protein [Aspergillus sclerotiicarbonarius CBS 121057]|uniref:Serum paraoxonase/arylesterase family protein n=1 Tax=Aspergillus sclerotiicarbonarius (strain CBS 121057 / IBT 28362) TaxID=1448318 RepID=A0A319EM92_ASPSB|nr:serum paraoxonase/arylesterase family protein [Aspergillus sclerotiicarbonarius CBS 121057]